MARPDPDTLQNGTNGPFEPWESDHTALVHVLWGARHQDLNLKDNADEIAEMILGSRWLAARQHRASEAPAETRPSWAEYNAALSEREPLPARKPEVSLATAREMAAEYARREET